ncbi:hypothetical protein BDW67DRAFT_165105 [Aspergillus spinulosporus]
MSPQKHSFLVDSMRLPSNEDEVQPPRVAAKKRYHRPSVSKQPGAGSQKSVDKKERRRQQVLLAQRAYRARHEAHTRELQQRVARLESALERTCQAIVSFTDVLLGARIPASHQQIAHRLRDTVKTCLHSAMGGNGCLEESACSNQSEPLPKQTQTQGDHEEWPRSSQHAGLGVLAPARNAPFPLQFMPAAAGAATIEAPVFANQLRILCLYQGFLLLKNPSVPLEALKRPFRLFLSVVPRETIASFFHACLQARLNNKQPDRCSDIPCFKLGGSGTHYSEVVVSSQNQIESSQEQHPPEIRVHDTLSAFSPEAQSDLDGDWFDLFDLMGYLRAHGVALSTVPPAGDTAYRTVNAVDFAAALVEKGICLGHSPGFKKSDVEVAINSSSWK